MVLCERMYKSSLLMQLTLSLPLYYNRALVYRSNVAKASLNPYWNEDVVPLTTLCNGKMDREIQISVWDTPARVLLGCTTTCINGLMDAVNERGNAEKALDLLRPSHNPLSTTQQQGKLVVLHASVESNNTSGSFHSSRTSTAPIRQESLSNLPQAVAVEILGPPQNVTFDDYMSSTEQCSLELCVAIDFTRANGAYCFGHHCFGIEYSYSLVPFHL